MKGVAKVLLTRPRDASDRVLAGLPSDVRACIDPILSPIYEIEPCVSDIHLGPAQGVIFTSQNAVAVAAKVGVIPDLPAYAVGEKTTQAARDRGWRARCVGKTADELVAALPGLAPQTPLAHLHGRHARGDIAARLSDLGLPAVSHVIYDQKVKPLTRDALDALRGSSPVIVPLYSPRAAKLFNAIENVSAPLRFIALSAAVAEKVHMNDTSCLQITREPTGAAMHASLCDTIRAVCRVEGPKTHR